MLREADLADLQGRYAAALSVQEQQQQILVALKGKLNALYEYFNLSANGAS
jgi:hypothetical protein